MQWQRFLTTLVLLLTAVGGLVGMTGTAHAASQATFGPPTEGTKVISSETSIDGPAITNAYGQTVLGWTGTDSAHRLNLMTSTDGLHYGHKLILPETSLWRPALGFFDSGLGAPYGTLVLAWTGTDSAHTLNIELIGTPNFNVERKVTFWGQTSFTAPGLTVIPGDVNNYVYLTWAGTDNAHTVNVLEYQTYDQTQRQTILRGWSSISRPNISTELVNSSYGLILSWTGVNNHIYFANTKDRVHWTMPNTSPLARQSAWAPSMISFFTNVSMPTYWLASTGTGTTSTKQLVIQYTQHFPSWNDPGSTATLAESAISSPALDFNGIARQVLIAWTGTDSSHRLNVAVVTVGQPSTAITAAIVGVTMFSPTTGWGNVATTHQIAYTTDGGYTWYDVTPQGLVPPGMSGSDLYAQSATQARTWSAMSSTGLTALYHTTDAGAHWAKSTVTLNPSQELGIAQLDFIDSQHGWLAGINGSFTGHTPIDVWGTTNGGTTWSKVSGPIILSHDNGISFVSTTTGFATAFDVGSGNLMIVKSTDGGHTWSNVSLPAPSDFWAQGAQSVVYPPVFTSANNGIMVVLYPTHTSYKLVVYFTSNAGKTWGLGPAFTLATFPISGIEPFSVTTGGEIFASSISSNGSVTLYHFPVGGTHWYKINTTNSGLFTGITVLDFVDASHGWAVTKSGLITTSDGGVTWAMVHA